MEKIDNLSLLEHVIEVSRRMAATRELDPLLSYAIDEVLLLVGAERGYIVLLTTGGSLDYRVQQRQDGQKLDEEEDPISHSILDEVVHTGQSLVLANAMTDPRFTTSHSVMFMRLRSVMCVPLKTHEQIIGAIYVENRSIDGLFREKDLPILELFANQAAVAIDNARLNEELTQANQDLQALDELKSKLIILVSHELQTPISVLYAYMGLVKQAPQPQLIENLNSAVDRVVGLIKEIIEIFRILSDQIDMEITTNKLAPLFEGILDDFAQAIAERNLTIKVSGISDLPVVPMDGTKMRTVWVNLIGNAIKYTPDGGQIEINGRVLENEVELSIHDHGIGIPVEKQEHIFDLFYTLGPIKHHSTSKTAFRGGGLGLGLPIAKGLVAAHGGTIRLESAGYDLEERPGTTIFVKLPLQPN